jgi:hypothetical protein
MLHLTIYELKSQEEVSQLIPHRREMFLWSVGQAHVSRKRSVFSVSQVVTPSTPQKCRTGNPAQWPLRNP